MWRNDMKKKIFALVLALTMVLGLNTTVFASELWEDGQSASSTVTYYVDSSYSIYIPETIDLGEGYTFQASYLNITDNQQVNVSITNLTSAGYLEMTSDSGNQIYMQLNGIGDYNRVATFTSDSTTSPITIYGQVAENSYAKAGTYTGTAEFSVSLGIRE